MIRRLLLAAIVGIMSLPMVAQDYDDMYFVPKKQSKDVIEFKKNNNLFYKTVFLCFVIWYHINDRISDYVEENKK